MPKKFRVPSYRRHKASGQAVVVLDGRSVYLGRWQSPESRSEYERVVSEWLASRRRLPGPASPRGPAAPDGLSVSEVILAFWEHARRHYRHADGAPTRELDNLRAALGPLRKLYGHTPARDFGPLALRAVQAEMVRLGWCRGVVNAQLKRVRRAFRWATSVELVPASVLQALETVAALKRGRCDARESEGVGPVDWAHVEATLPFLPAPVAAMVRVMRYSNCRAEDVVLMRGRDLVAAGALWEYRPARHKNQWREEACPTHRRVVCLGPQCQRVLAPFLRADPEAYLFSPRQSRAEYQARRAAARKTRRTPSELRRRGKATPRRAPGERYTVNTLQQCVRRACRKAGVPPWTVLQVRHTRATEVRERYGLEGAAASLGDRVEAAQIYAERNRELARKIAWEEG